MDEVEARDLFRRLDDSVTEFYRHDGVADPAPTVQSSGKGLESFRFTSLPPEIRNSIYRYAVQTEVPLRLRRFKPASITRASQQLRAESLPIFFDVNLFVAEVKSTLIVETWFISPYDARFKNAGTLRLSRGIVSMFKIAGKQTVRFRNLVLIPMDYEDFTTNQPWYYDGMVSLRTLGTPLRAQVSCHSGLEWQEFDDEGDIENIRHLLQPARIFLESQVAKPGFKGLSLAGLKELASKLRVIPRAGAKIREVGR